MAGPTSNRRHASGASRRCQRLPRRKPSLPLEPRSHPPPPLNRQVATPPPSSSLTWNDVEARRLEWLNGKSGKRPNGGGNSADQEIGRNLGSGPVLVSLRNHVGGRWWQGQRYEEVDRHCLRPRR